MLLKQKSVKHKWFISKTKGLYNRSCKYLWVSHDAQHVDTRAP